MNGRFQCIGWQKYRTFFYGKNLIPLYINVNMYTGLSTKMQTWETNPYSSYCNYLIAVYTIPQSVFWGGPEKINPAVFSKIKISKNEFESGFFISIIAFTTAVSPQQTNFKGKYSIYRVYGHYLFLIFCGYDCTLRAQILRQGIVMKPSIGNWI